MSTSRAPAPLRRRGPRVQHHLRTGPSGADLPIPVEPAATGKRGSRLSDRGPPSSEPGSCGTRAATFLTRAILMASAPLVLTTCNCLYCSTAALLCTAYCCTTGPRRLTARARRSSRPALFLLRPPPRGRDAGGALALLRSTCGGPARRPPDAFSHPHPAPGRPYSLLLPPWWREASCGTATACTAYCCTTGPRRSAACTGQADLLRRCFPGGHPQPVCSATTENLAATPVHVYSGHDSFSRVPQP